MIRYRMPVANALTFGPLVAARQARRDARRQRQPGVVQERDQLGPAPGRCRRRRCPRIAPISRMSIWVSAAKIGVDDQQRPGIARDLAQPPGRAAAQRDRLRPDRVARQVERQRRAEAVPDRAAEGGAHDTGARQHQRDAGARLDRALREDSRRLRRTRPIASNAVR